MSACDVAVIGAGPYGLAAGAHLSGVKGLEVRVFGEPMDFWKTHMPSGMLLRSTRTTSDISDPAGALKIEAFGALRHGSLPDPIPLDHFVDYGLWFQRTALPSLDRRPIRQVERASPGFRLSLESGESLTSRRVVIAAGIGPFAIWPEVFAGLSPRFVTHCSDHKDLGRFRGRRVVVVGAGPSALESAALIQEAGGTVEVLVRGPGIPWHGSGGREAGWQNFVRGSKALEKILYAPTGVGPAGISRIVGHPHALKYFPRSLQDTFRVKSLRPTPFRSLQERLTNVTITVSSHVVSAAQKGEDLSLKLKDGGERRVDHVLLGTGYKVDVARYPFLSPELVRGIRMTDGFPHLTAGLESSVPGLHFLGAPAGWTFGPLMYFVAGTGFAASNLARYLRKGRPR